MGELNNSPLVLDFFPKFLMFLAVFQLTVFFIHSSEMLSQAIQLAITYSVAFVYQMFAEPIIIDGNILRHADSSHFLIVDNECTGLMLFASVSAVVMTFSYSLTTKVKMLVIAALILQGENTLRITHLMYEVRKETNDFEFYHLYIWQMINFITALLVIAGLERFFRSREL